MLYIKPMVKSWTSTILAHISLSTLLRRHLRAIKCIQPTATRRTNRGVVKCNYLQKSMGGDDTKVVMLGFDYFVQYRWEEDKEGQTKTGTMLKGITGFANHSEHHAIVMYSYVDESGAKRILIPDTWQRLLKSSRYSDILSTLLTGSPKEAHEDLTWLIESWRDVDLSKAPFLP